MAAPDKALTIQEVGRIYGRSEGSIRTAIWRFRRFGDDPGFPLPVLIGGRYRWLESIVAQHLRSLADAQQAAASARATSPISQTRR